ncbi:DUF1127 domain-containing protein [Geminicoccus roseus]|uniref:DUF1127 domain-containing protein n=1 Tax=Geminicoccus roseus TaxID=404900 RepID=UPI000A03602E|nr:DUF1127 domain-containing protein [Geminicoccus roseus]
MGIVQQILDSLGTQFRAYETRRSLNRLSDRSLADLGMERDLIADIATMAAARNSGTVSLAEIRDMAQQAMQARQVEQLAPSSPSPLAALLGTPKSSRLALAD